MRYVKYTDNYNYYKQLTINKVYEVIDISSVFNGNVKTLLLIDDDGTEDWFIFRGLTGPNLFKDVTSKYRSLLIDNILK